MFRTAFQTIGRRHLHASARQNIQVGDTLPNIKVQLSSPAETINVRDLFSTSKKAILFGVPGAFTPGCSKTHLPGYIKAAERLKTKQGVDLIACVSVNDAFVMTAWGKDVNLDTNNITLLADSKGELAQSMNLAFDASGALGNHRFQRFAAIIENGVVKKLFVEPDRTGLEVSLVENVEKHL
ncbi:Redoxin [Halteromyces radiatus]|uniref:Redoxin n=1 Tax=Halteromyces radiatus TaxID=101107 RepID=UPI00222110BD|nr:Redoxin [Halteromyces radiatus]KAI8077734.1 Redoxin [Halteromyces radiatus]